jgi:chromosome condensin MukBEF MukE localization factor
MKLSIRDLFLVTLVVALAFGWWVDRERLRSQLRSAERLRQLGQIVPGHQASRISLPKSQAPAPNPPKP